MTTRLEREAALMGAYDIGRSLTPYSDSTQFVPGVGDVLSRVMLIGEAPGGDEDRLGEPFVGRAGSLLNTALEIHGIPREAVFITNVVKYRPPGNRKPTNEEIEQHLPVLARELEVIEPIGILCLGGTALEALTGKGHMGSARGKELDSLLPFNGILMATYHPSYILRGGMKREEWYKDFENFFETATNLLLARTS